MENRKQDAQKKVTIGRDDANGELYIPLRFLLDGMIEVPNVDEAGGDQSSFIFGMQWIAAYAASRFGVFIDEPDEVIAERKKKEWLPPTAEEISEMMDYLNQTFDYMYVDEERVRLHMYLLKEHCDDDCEDECEDECDCCCDDCFCDEESVDDVVESLHEAADGHSEYMEKTGKTVEDALAEAMYVIDALREELNNSRDEIGKLEKQVGRLEGLVTSRKKNGFGGKGA